MIVCRSKSGGAHAFLFTKEFVPATVMRVKLKLIASAMGFAGVEIFPKQDYIRVDRGDTGSFLNLPYTISSQFLTPKFFKFVIKFNFIVKPQESCEALILCLKTILSTRYCILYLAKRRDH